MVRSKIGAILCGLVICSGVAAMDGSAPGTSSLQQRINDLLQQAGQLQRHIQQIEHSLEFPFGGRVAVFISNSSRAGSFEPTHLILRFDDGSQLQQYLDPHQKQAFATGAPIRIVSHPLSARPNTLAVTISGHDSQGKWLAETLSQTVIPADSTVYLEYSFADAADGGNRWRPSVW